MMHVTLSRLLANGSYCFFLFKMQDSDNLTLGKLSHLFGWLTEGHRTLLCMCTHTHTCVCVYVCLQNSIVKKFLKLACEIRSRMFYFLNTH